MNQIARYALAALLVLLETAMFLALGRLLDLDRAPFLLFTPSVLLAAMLGGRDAGLLATALGVVAAEVVFREEARSRWEAFEFIRMALFVVSGAWISILSGHLQQARARAEERADAARKRAEELAAARAIAERHARDAERRAAELDALFDVSPVGLARADDPECRYIAVNRTLALRLGVAASGNASLSAPLSEQPPFRVTRFDGTPLAPHELPLQRAARTKEPVVDAEFAAVRDDGGVVVMQAHAVPLLDEHGDSRGAIGVFTDVSEQRRSGEEQRFLAEASRLLSSSLDYDETLRRVAGLAVPAMADWSVLDVVDGEGRLTRFGSVHRDAAAQAWLERQPALRPEAKVGTALTLTAIAQPLLVRHVDDAVLRSLGAVDWQVEGARLLGVASALIVPLTLHGTTMGAFAWMRGKVRPPFDDRDLTLAREAGRRATMSIEHARLYREAQLANRLKDEFVATLSHELRTPLNALLGWTDLLRSGRLSVERQREAIDAVHRTALAQAKLTNDLVDVSRAVSGKFRLRPEDVDVGAVVRDTTETFRLAAESKGLRLTCDLAPNLPRIVADPDRLRQIVYNLVGNAVKFTAVGAVDVVARAEGDWLTLRVHDSGIGIRAAFLPYVFDRFRQADGSVSREFGGLGLGLSIVRALVELHGGTVTAESRGEGAGATFSVRLPVAVPQPRRHTDIVGARSE
ncbi:MAG: PAS domain-containing protein [Acidobacteria bacterium]|nr:PAS domain-containing protein [Acidobacteriota bacterium]